MIKVTEVKLAGTETATKPARDLSAALDRATRLIDAVCCVSGSLTFVADIQADRGPGSLYRAVINGHTPALFDWMMDSFSYQGISNEVAAGYMSRHGNVTWQQLESAFASQPPCPRLASYWTYDSCRYDKTSSCCSEPEHIGDCPVPLQRLRNGRLNQMAYSLYLFIRDVAQSDFAGWVDRQLSTVSSADPHYIEQMHEALVAPMRHIFGVSDKVLTMTLSEILMAAPRARPSWFNVGSQMIAVDTLVHNFLHRTGILDDFGARHAYGRTCYHVGSCAEILRQVSAQIDAKRFNKTFPSNFPRFVQHAVWHYCAAEGENICNGNMIDDSKSCQQLYCILYSICSRVPLNKRI